MCESVLTQTIPGPPPGAGAVRVADSAFADEVAAPAAGLGDVFGLNKSARVFFAGEAVGAAAAGVVIADFFRDVLAAPSTGTWVVAAGEAFVAAEDSGVADAFFRDFLAGEADASAAAPPLAGDASVAAAAFFRDFFPGEADASAAGDSFAAGDASAAAFLRECFAGEAEAFGVGD